MDPFRESILQEANSKNQVYQSTHKSLQSFLEKIPTEQINSSDDLSQVSAKQSSQEVRTTLTSLLHHPVVWCLWLFPCCCCSNR